MVVLLGVVVGGVGDGSDVGGCGFCCSMEAVMLVMMVVELFVMSVAFVGDRGGDVGGGVGNSGVVGVGDSVCW